MLNISAKLFSRSDGGDRGGESDEDDPFNNYFHFDDEDFDVSHNRPFKFPLNVFGISQFYQ